MRRLMDGKTAGPPRKRNGFALIEVLTAGLVLALAVLGLSASLANGSKLADGSREELAARDALRDMHARLAEAPFDKVAVAFHTRGFVVPGLAPVLGDTDGQVGEIVFGPGPENARDVYRVTLRVRWRGRSGEQLIENTYYLANVRGDPGVPPTIEEVEAALAAQ